jgi:hypothetical protein
MKKAALWLVVCLVFAGVLVVGAVALGFALIAGPVVLLAGYLLAGRRAIRPASEARRQAPSVYEGEFRVLDETPVER